VPICASLYIILTIIIVIPSNSKYSVEKCDNNNYYDRAYVQKLQLIEERLWELGNRVMVKTWVKRDEEVLATIVGNVRKSQFHHTTTGFRVPAL